MTDEMTHTAAEILGYVNELLAFHQRGLMDVEDDMKLALKAFDEAECQSIADAQAFLMMAQYMVSQVLKDCRAGLGIDDAGEECLTASDRYTDIAMAFLSSEQDRQATGFRPGKTLH